MKDVAHEAGLCFELSDELRQAIEARSSERLKKAPSSLFRVMPSAGDRFVAQNAPWKPRGGDFVAQNAAWEREAGHFVAQNAAWERTDPRR